MSFDHSTSKAVPVLKKNSMDFRIGDAFYWTQFLLHVHKLQYLVLAVDTKN